MTLASADAPRAGGLGLRAYFSDLARAASAAAHRADGWIGRDIVVAGATICLRFAGTALLDVLFPPLSHLVAPEPRATTPDASFSIWDTTSTGVPLPPVPWRPESLDARGHVGDATDGIAAFHNTHFGGITVFDAVTATGVYSVASPRMIPWYERGSPLRTALHLALPASAGHLIHAGAIGTASTGVLIGGRSGSGKSTTTLACVLAGFGTVGDDYVVVSLDRSPTAHSLYATAKLDPDALERLPALAGAVDAGSSCPEKAVLDLNRGFADRIRRSIPITALVLPRVGSHARTELRPINRGDALRALGPSTVIQMPHRSANVLAAIARLVKEVPSYRLELGTDGPAAAVERLRSLLATR